MISVIRYPGSKAKLADQIWGMFPEQIKYPLWAMSGRPMEYREPFFGAGAVGFKVLHHLPPATPVWLNDLDYGMYSLWRCVLENPKHLLQQCQKFRPSPEWFYKFKGEDGDTSLPIEQAGFRKLALHRMSFSGLGAKAGGPIGGKAQQTAAYSIECRWNPSNIKKSVMIAHRLLAKFDELRITRMDFQKLIDGAPQNCFIYLDPPYYEKGPELYVHSMNPADHARLSDSLGLCKAEWVLSYDDHREVRMLYGGSVFRDLHVTYSMGVSKVARPKNREVLIFPQRAATVPA